MRRIGRSPVFFHLAVTLIAVMSVSGQELPQEDAPVEVPSLRLLGLGEYEGPLGDNVATHMELASIPDFAAVEDPILLDGSDLDQLSPGQVFTLRRAYFAGIPVLLLHPEETHMEALATLVGLEPFTAEEEQERDLDLAAEPLDAIALYNGPDSQEIVWFHARPDGTENQEDFRLLQLSDWLTTCCSNGAEKSVAMASRVRSGQSEDVRKKVRPYLRTVRFTVRRAHHQIGMHVWGVRELERNNPQTHYLVDLLTTWSAGNYNSAGGCCDDDRCKCFRRGYLKDFTFEILPSQRFVRLDRYSPDTDRQKQKFTVNNGWNIGGKVGASIKAGSKDGKPALEAGYSAEFSFGLHGGTSRTVEIKDGWVLAIAGRSSERSVGWDYRMKQPRGVQIIAETDQEAGCNRLLDLPPLISRGSYQTQQFVGYRGASSEFDGAHGFYVKVRVSATEEDAQMFTNGGVPPDNPDCNFFGCNCEPRYYSRGPELTSIGFRFPSVPVPAPVERPRIERIEPNRGQAGTVVTLIGEGLSGARRVRFGAVNAVPVPTSNTRIEVLVPAPDELSPSDRVPVTVLTDGGLSNSKSFTYR